MNSRKQFELLHLNTPKIAAKLERYSVDSSGCWVFQAIALRKGYANISFRVDGKRYQVGAHRASYMIRSGEIPEGLVIDHVCRNRRCINPEHLRAVTSAVNAIENNVGPTAVNARKTHCIRGHELSGDNTYLYRGMRKCRTCLQFISKNRRKKVKS